jgi:hypothetical protein
MKKLLISALLTILSISTYAQSNALQTAVTQLDQAKTVNDYRQLEKTFTGTSGTPAWLSPYYAALCNAKIGFLLQDDGEKIEPYSERGEQQAKQALALLDSSRQHKERAEVYTVLSMIYRTKVFINPMTYGRKYGMLSQQMLDKAIALEPQNPRALYVAAWVKFYTPKMWGGDKEKAKQLAGESLAKLGNPGTDVYPHWGKAEDQLLLSKIK